ncbi:carbohydrate binding domain-containing protein [Candidatus Poribacteria bacterium]
MKHLIVFTLVMSLCVILPNSLLAQKGEMLDFGENRLHNGDFEDEPIAPWQLEVRADMGAAAMIETIKKDAVSGDRCVKVTVTVSTGANWHVKLRQDDRSFEANEKFTVAFWCKAEEARSIEVAFQLQHDPWTTFNTTTVPIGTEWEEYTVTFTPGVDNFQDHWLAFQLAALDIPVWFDDVRYFLGEPGDEPDRELVKPAVDPKAKFATKWSQIRSEY